MYESNDNPTSIIDFLPNPIEDYPSSFTAITDYIYKNMSTMPYSVARAQAHRSGMLHMAIIHWDELSPECRVFMDNSAKRILMSETGMRMILQ